MQTPKAWVIDKDPNFQTHLRSFLDTIGYSAKCFSDGEESLYHLGEKPDFIILDSNLNGGLNGLDVMRTIKVNTAIPLIYLSDEEREKLSRQNEMFGKLLMILRSKLPKLTFAFTLSLIAVFTFATILSLKIKGTATAAIISKTRIANKVISIFFMTSKFVH